MESSLIRRWRSVVTILMVMCTVALCATRQPPLTSSALEEEFALTPKTHVIILNTLGSGSKVNIHCKSGDDDLGAHVIDDDQLYEIVFRPNIFHTTLYFCSFSWTGGSVYGVVYKAKRDSPRCGKECTWTITKEGINGRNHYGDIDIVYKWN